MFGDSRIIIAPPKGITFFLTITNRCGRTLFFRSIHRGKTVVTINGGGEYFISLVPLSSARIKEYRYVKLTDCTRDVSIAPAFRKKTVFALQSFTLRDGNYGFMVKSARLIFEETAK